MNKEVSMGLILNKVFTFVKIKIVHNTPFEIVIGQVFNSNNKQYLDMKKKVVLNFSNMDYNIEGIDYRYNDAKPPIFYTNATVKVPDEFFKESMTIGLPLDRTMEFVEKHNSGMAKYVRKVIEGYSDQPESELLAFESLEHDGFDLKQFMSYMLTELSIEIERT